MKWFLGLLGTLGLAVLGIALFRWLTGCGVLSAYTSHTSARTGYSVWCYEGKSWTLKEDKPAPGHVRGRAPQEPGVCEGYCVKVPAVPEVRMR
jgi:hypothetical protein